MERGLTRSRWHVSTPPADLAGAGVLGAVVAVLPKAATAQADFPMTYLRAMGTQAEAVVGHLWGLLGISIAVVVIISGLVLVGTLLKRGPAGAVPGWLPVLRTLAGTSWITIGVGISTVVLVGSMAWSAVVLTEISAPPSEPAFTIEVNGHMWWWEVTYTAEDPSRSFETANEIHVPVGKPVRFKLTSADVIHSFWIPLLGGKTDLIPGKTNYAWLEASQPGVYRGQCQEYCGLQHALMGLAVFAQEPRAFKEWWNEQLEPADEPRNPPIERGQRLFVAKCTKCHTVRGTAADGNVGPDLTHLMSRETIAALTLPNTMGHLSGWVANPQGIKPGARMPNVDLSGPELVSILTYLQTLR